jgi:uncharacterized membrane protein HdeD (DUF308 family)
MGRLRIPLRIRSAALLVRGAAAVASGILAFNAAPELAKLLLGAYLAADGLVSLALVPQLALRRSARLLFAVDGFADVLVAAILIVWVPPVALLILVVAIWTTVTGILELAASLMVPRLPGIAWTIALVGLLSCCVGAVVLDWTSLTEIALLYVLAAYAIVVSALLLAIGVLLAQALRLRT